MLDANLHVAYLPYSRHCWHLIILQKEQIPTLLFGGGSAQHNWANRNILFCLSQNGVQGSLHQSSCYDEHINASFPCGFFHVVVVVPHHPVMDIHPHLKPAIITSTTWYYLLLNPVTALLHLPSNHNTITLSNLVSPPGPPKPIATIQVYWLVFYLNEIGVISLYSVAPPSHTCLCVQSLVL